jgi:hypothetical protein
VQGKVNALKQTPALHNCKVKMACRPLQSDKSVRHRSIQTLQGLSHIDDIDHMDGLHTILVDDMLVLDDMGGLRYAIPAQVVAGWSARCLL